MSINTERQVQRSETEQRFLEGLDFIVPDVSVAERSTLKVCLPECFSSSGAVAENGYPLVSCSMPLDKWLYFAQGLSELLCLYTELADEDELCFFEGTHVSKAKEMESDINKLCHSYVIQNWEGGVV